MTHSAEMPQGWQAATLGELCLVNPKHGKQLPDDTKVSFVPMAAVDEVSGSIVAERTEERTLGEVRRGYTHFSDGDVIFAKITPCMQNGKSAVAGELKSGLACGSTEFFVLRSDGAVDPRLLHAFLRQKSFRDSAQRAMTGVVGQARVPRTYLVEHQIPLPPLNEQRRIVDKIEALTAKSSRAKEALDAIPPLLERFRRSVLGAAFCGDLTADWRAQNPNVEPADQLLGRMCKERRASWEKAELAKMKAKGKEPKNDKWKSKYKEPENQDHSGFPALPESWCYATLGHFAWFVKDGPHHSPKYAGRGIPFISGRNVRPSGVDFSDAKYISRELHERLSKRCVPELGDILYTKGGTTGIARVNTYDRAFNVWVHVAVLKLVPSVRSFFLQHVLNSPDAYRQAQKFTHGVGNQDLGLTRMVKIVLPVAPLPEQDEMIRRVDALLEVADRVEQVLEGTLAAGEKLDQAILARAFRGNLVPQDPNDEPASVLLDRIRTEREKATRKKRTRRKRKGAEASAE